MDFRSYGVPHEFEEILPRSFIQLLKSFKEEEKINSELPPLLRKSLFSFPSTTIRLFNVWI